MKFSKTKVTIKPWKCLSTTVAAVGGGEAQHVMKIEIPIEVVVDKKLLKDEEFNKLFPFADEAIKVISAREGEEQRGLDMKSRGDLQPINVKLWDTVPSEKPAFTFTGCEVKGAATLKVDDKGDSVLCSKICVLVTQEQLGRLGPYTKGEILIEAEASQSSIFDIISDVDEPDDEAADSDADPFDGDEKPAKKTPKQAKNEGTAVRKKREPLENDSVEGAISYLSTPEAESLAKEAVQLNTVKTDVAGLFASARKNARKRGGLQQKKVTVKLEDMKKALGEQASDEHKQAAE